MKTLLIITPKHLNRILHKQIRAKYNNHIIDGALYTVKPFTGIAQSGTSIEVIIETTKKELDLTDFEMFMQEKIVFINDKAVTKDFITITRIVLDQ